MARREPGSGSITADPSRGPNHWVLSVEAGWTRRGTRRRKRRRFRGTKAAAGRELRRWLNELAAGDPEVDTRTTVATYAKTWLDTQQHRLRPKAYSATKGGIAWAVEAIGHRRISQLTPSDIRSVSRAIIDAGHTPSTAARHHNELLRMLRDARADGHQLRDSVPDTAPPRQGESERRALNPEDARALLDVALGMVDGARWWLALIYGVRPAEARGLTWECIDLTGEHAVVDVSWQLQALPYRVPYNRASGFRVPDGHTARHLVDAQHLTRPKTRKGRRTFAVDELTTALLRSWHQVATPSPHGLVFPSADGAPLGGKADRQRWRDLCTEAGVDAADLYAARHTSISAAVKAGVDPSVLADVVGHSRLVRSYVHVDAEQRAAVGAAVLRELS